MSPSKHFTETTKRHLHMNRFSKHTASNNHSKKSSKKRRKMAAKSRKLNRGKK
jgi:hypothetical protein